MQQVNGADHVRACLQGSLGPTSDANDRRVGGIVVDFTGQHRLRRCGRAGRRELPPPTVPYVSGEVSSPAAAADCRPRHRRRQPSAAKHRRPRPSPAGRLPTVLTSRADRRPDGPVIASVRRALVMRLCLARPPQRRRELAGPRRACRRPGAYR